VSPGALRFPAAAACRRPVPGVTIMDERVGGGAR